MAQTRDYTRSNYTWTNLLSYDTPVHVWNWWSLDVKHDMRQRESRGGYIYGLWLNSSVCGSSIYIYINYNMCADLDCCVLYQRLFAITKAKSLLLLFEVGVYRTCSFTSLFLHSPVQSSSVCMFCSFRRGLCNGGIIIRYCTAGTCSAI